MAVYTEVSDEDLAAFIASYGLGALLSYKGIAEGVENTNYLLQTGKGPYFLTLYEKRTAPADLPFFLGLMEHLAKAGLNCPTPVHDLNGTVLRALAGRPAAHRHLSGGHLDQAAPGAPLSCRRRGSGQTAPRGPRFRTDPTQRARTEGLAPALPKLSGRAPTRSPPNCPGSSSRSSPGSKPSGLLAWSRESSTPTSFPTTSSSSAIGCPASSISISPATTHWPTTSPSRSTRGASRATSPSMSPRPRRCSRDTKASVRLRRRSARRCRFSPEARRCGSCSPAPTTGCIPRAMRS